MKARRLTITILWILWKNYQHYFDHCLRDRLTFDVNLGPGVPNIWSNIHNSSKRYVNMISSFFSVGSKNHFQWILKSNPVFHTPKVWSLAAALPAACKLLLVSSFVRLRPTQHLHFLSYAAIYWIAREPISVDWAWIWSTKLVATATSLEGSKT